MSDFMPVDMQGDTIFYATNSTNSTDLGSADGATSMHKQAISYFMTLWPVMMSMGMGGGVIGVFYQIINYFFD